MKKHSNYPGEDIRRRHERIIKERCERDATALNALSWFVLGMAVMTAVFIIGLIIGSV